MGRGRDCQIMMPALNSIQERSFLPSFFPSLPPRLVPDNNCNLVLRTAICIGQSGKKKREEVVPSVKEWRKGKVATAINGGQSVLKTYRN